MVIDLTQRIVPSLRTFQFVPHENWTLAAEVFEKSFDPTTRIESSRYVKYLARTIPGYSLRASKMSESAYRAGRLVVADAGNKWAEGRRFFRPANEAQNGQIVLPGQTRDIVLTFQISPIFNLREAPAELLDRDPTTGLSPGKKPIHLGLPKGLRSVIFLFSGPADLANIHVTLWDTAGCLRAPAPLIGAGNALIVMVEGVDDRDFTLRLDATDSRPPVVEVWAIPRPANSFARQRRVRERQETHRISQKKRLVPRGAEPESEDLPHQHFVHRAARSHGILTRSIYFRRLTSPPPRDDFFAVAC
ncbi:MAG: hypothetical protein PHC88_03880 [Terrimicrobiaceae bacterium]|nr:hypothetical protein [Terrimicrobiaceae bacterium]